MTPRPARGGPRRHRPGDPETYAVGEWPVLEALEHRPGAVRLVLLDPALPLERRERLLRKAGDAGVPWREDAHALAALRHRSDARAAAIVRTQTDVLDATRDHLTLVGTRSPGNLGVALRTALGFDLRDVALVASPLDPWSPHVLRASQGARFALRVTRFTEWRAYRERFPGHRIVWFAPPRSDTATAALGTLQLAGPRALVFGPEWASTSATNVTAASAAVARAAAAEIVTDSASARRARAAAQAAAEAAMHAAARVSIPQHPDLESHNLAVAVGIALYALSEQPAH